MGSEPAPEVLSLAFSHRARGEETQFPRKHKQLRLLRNSAGLARVLAFLSRDGARPFPRFSGRRVRTRQRRGGRSHGPFGAAARGEL